jgi:hypothetical protein
MSSIFICPKKREREGADVAPDMNREERLDLEDYKIKNQRMLTLVRITIKYFLA